jgi:hypothetical protein
MHQYIMSESGGVAGGIGSLMYSLPDSITPSPRSTPVSEEVEHLEHPMRVVAVRGTCQLPSTGGHTHPDEHTGSWR